MAEVPVWLAGIGTTGTLVTGMYMMLQDRQDRKRSLILPVRCTVSLGRVDDSTLTLVTVNPTPDPIYDLTYYVIANVTFVSGETKGVGCRFRYTELGGGWRFEYDVLQDVRNLNVGPEAVSTCIATDIAGRTWLKQRRKSYRQSTSLTKWGISRRMTRFEKLWEEQEITIDVNWEEGRWVNLDSTSPLRQLSRP